MKTLAIAAITASFLVAAGSAHAAPFVTDSLLQDFAASGHVINPHGNLAGR